MLFPYATERETERFPWATVALIAVNCLVFILQTALGWRMETNPLVLDPDSFALWQPLTSLFAHADPFHLGGNMVFLWVFGSHAEDVLGVKRYLAVYLGAGLAASALQTAVDLVATHQAIGGLGASGAIMGLLALFVLRFPRVHVRILYWFYFIYYGTWLVEARWVALFYVGMDLLSGIWQVLMGELGGVGHWAHLGGFAAGAAVAVKLNLPQAAATDVAREEIGRLAASGALKLAAAKAIEQADAAPADAALQELAAAHCSASSEFAARAVGYWLRALSLHLAAERPDEALRCYARAQTSAGELALPLPLRLSMAEVHLRQGAPTEAIALLRAVLTQGAPAGERAEAALRAGEIAALRLGDSALAAQYFRYVLHHFPDSRQALEAHDWLRRLSA